MNVQKPINNYKKLKVDLLDKYPKFLAVLLSVVAAVVYALFIEPIIKEVQKLKFLEMTIGFSVPNETPFSVETSLITVVFFVIILLSLVIFITYISVQNRTQNNIKEVLPNSPYCDHCKEVDSLKQKNTDKQQQYDNLLLEYNDALPYKKLTDCLNEFFNENEILESIQLFSTPKLPTIEEANTMDEINITLQFVDGRAKTSSNTNALFNINYVFEKSIYHDIKKLFDVRNKYYSTNNKQRDPNTEKDIQHDAIELFNKIKGDLDNITSIRDIQDTHYACYKLLEILANVVIGNESIVNCDQLLQLKEIEQQLKYGQRTGMLGAIFTENLYCFYNESSLTKKDRMYFSVPILYKQQQLILLGICNKNDLKVTTNCDYLKCCEHIYESIRKVLSKMEG